METSGLRSFDLEHRPLEIPIHAERVRELDDPAEARLLVVVRLATLDLLLLEPAVRGELLLRPAP